MPRRLGYAVVFTPTAGGFMMSNPTVNFGQPTFVPALVQPGTIGPPPPPPVMTASGVLPPPASAPPPPPPVPSGPSLMPATVPLPPAPGSSTDFLTDSPTAPASVNGQPVDASIVPSMSPMVMAAIAVALLYLVSRNRGR